MKQNEAPEKRCFTRDYEVGRSAAMRDLVRDVLGCDYPATSWTTPAEAATVASLLGLRPKMRLLDIGAGAGWPGLYLTLLSGCDLVLTDIPHNGIRLALERGARDGSAERCVGVVADGTALPFAPASFDAVTHSDVLCCMAEKAVLLRECRRAARDGASMVFAVIEPAPGLSAAERRVAIESGPPFVDVESDYGELLERCGWRVLRRIDVSGVFAGSVRTSIESLRARAEAFMEVLGAEDYRERVEHQSATLAAVGQGVLRREIFVAAAAPAGAAR